MSAKEPSELSTRTNNAGFIAFLKQHSSPQHQRVTAGGKIVPMNPPRSVEDPSPQMVIGMSSNPSQPGMSQPFVDDQTTTMNNERPTGTENVRLIGNTTCRSVNGDDMAAAPFVPNQESAQGAVNIASPGLRDPPRPLISYIQHPLLQGDEANTPGCSCRLCVQDDPEFTPEGRERRWALIEQDIDCTFKEIGGMWFYLNLGRWPPLNFYKAFAERIMKEGSDAWAEGETLLRHKLRSHERYLVELNHAIAMQPATPAAWLMLRVSQTKERGLLLDAIALLDGGRLMGHVPPRVRAIFPQNTAPGAGDDLSLPPLFRLPGPRRSIPIIDPETGEDLSMSGDAAPFFRCSTDTEEARLRRFIMSGAGECSTPGHRLGVPLDEYQNEEVLRMVSKIKEPLHIPLMGFWDYTLAARASEALLEHEATRAFHAATRLVQHDSEEILASRNAEEFSRIEPPESQETLVAPTDEGAQQAVALQSEEISALPNDPPVAGYTVHSIQEPAVVQDNAGISWVAQEVWDRNLYLRSGVRSLPRNFGDELPPPLLWSTTSEHGDDGYIWDRRIIQNNDASTVSTFALSDDFDDLGEMGAWLTL